MDIKDLVTNTSPKVRIKELEKLVVRQAGMIEKLRAPRVSLPVGAKKRRGKSFLRVICGDTHGAYQDNDAVAAFLSDLKVLQPAEIIHIGDAIDCGGFLSSHGTLGVVPELAVTFEQDVLAANAFLDSVAKVAPNAKVTLFAGNHERRIASWVCKQVLENKANAEYLLRMFGPEAVLSVEKRGIRYIQRDQYYDGLGISGTIRLQPHAIAQHGESFCGKYASFRFLERFGKSVFFGHTHRLGATYAENLESNLVAVNTGCLCQVRPLYGLCKTTDWTHGYAIQIVSKDGFLAIPVPIINGTSYLQPLVHRLNLK